MRPAAWPPRCRPSPPKTCGRRFSRNAPPLRAGEQWELDEETLVLARSLAPETSLRSRTAAGERACRPEELQVAGGDRGVCRRRRWREPDRSDSLPATSSFAIVSRERLTFTIWGALVRSLKCAFRGGRCGPARRRPRSRARRLAADLRRAAGAALDVGLRQTLTCGPVASTGDEAAAGSAPALVTGREVDQLERR